MKILFLTEGGKNIGFGHIIRCTAFSDVFKLKGINSHFIINGDKTIFDIAKKLNYEIFDWVKNKKKTLEIAKKYDFVIIDSYIAPKKLYNEISKLKEGNILMIDDYKRINYPEGIVVNPSIYGDKLKYPKKKGVKYLLGPKYVILRKEFWEVPPRKITKKVKNVLITFGATATTEFIKKIKEVVKNNFHNVKINIVDPNKKKLTVRQMLNLMLKADLCISGGGQTLYELARLGAPTIGICFADNQFLNLKYFEKYGFLKFAGWKSDSRLFINLRKILDNIHKSRYYKVTGNNFDGIKLLVKPIMRNIVEKEVIIRNVRSNDIWKIYMLSNDTGVRKNSINSNLISKEEHVEWFKKVDKSFFYIAEFRKDIIGQVRFSKKTNKISIINISLSKTYRNIGVGELILKKIIYSFLRNNPKEKVIAYIKRENLSSIKLFEKCGFKKKGIEEMNKVLVFKYIYE